MIIEELAIPAGEDAAGWPDFAATTEIMVQLEAEGFGHDELRLSAAEVLPWWHDPANPRRLFAVRIDGTIVARAMYRWMLADPDTCWLAVGVLPPFRNRGIGTALTAHVEQLARAEGRSKAIASAVSRPAPGERVEPPTGFGSVPAANPEVRFLLRNGYRLEQVERNSRLALPVDVDVEPVAGYRLHFWGDRTPPHWLEQMALLRTRMSTDAPSAGLEMPEDVYTVERLSDVETAYERSPRTRLVAVVEHVASGQLAGYSVLTVPAETARAVHQDDTLVLREHRGHRLGMLLKVANIAELQRVHPGHPSIVTFNAEENRFMLDVNEAVGFVAMGYEGAWRRDL